MHLKPSETITLFKGKLSKDKYWKLTYNPDYKIKYNDALQEIKYLVEKSVQRTLISDVPLSIMLSGGVDSATSLSKKVLKNNITTFSIIDNDDRYNEIKNLNISTKYLKGRNIKLRLSKKNNNNFIKLNDLIGYHFKPVLTISSFLSSLLTKKIKNHNIKVNLSGIGADEVFRDITIIHCFI